jgi:hypothetical protein
MASSVTGVLGSDGGAVGQASSLPHSGPAVLLPKVAPVWSTLVDNQLTLPTFTSLPLFRVSLRSFNCRLILSSYRFIRCYPAYPVTKLPGSSTVCTFTPLK